MVKEEKGIGRRISQLDIRFLYVAMILFTMIPVIFPVGIPVAITRESRGFYDTIEKLPAGSVVVVENSLNTGYWGDIGACLVAVFSHLFSRPVKVIVYTLDAEGPLTLTLALDRVDPALKNAREYGKDWVFLGYTPGAEIAQASVAANIRGMFSKDFYGTPIDEVPVMKNVNSWKDVSVVIVMSRDQSASEYSIRQWHATYGVPLLLVVTGSQWGPLMPYFPTMVTGMLYGVRGGAEYETLIKRPGVGISGATSLSAMFFVVISALVLGNIGYALTWFEEKKGGK